ncbi:hypothetical protein J7E91_20360 [Streptomyces sp. ISL-99]|uniref:effector-associated constant component EACC1 n=1 Tax=Streptomyces sp. ISL-99 TaxID=2819193 RepID=UPI001BEC3DBE|nr:hypothetical protein [Streptomyces sp. ISL-99]MBT2527712.1 hypothetical protein [Streptomyces sp. ISL-99]
MTRATLYGTERTGSRVDRMDGTEIRFELAEGPDCDADLRSLYKWLSDDLSLRGHARIDKVAEGTAVPGRMGIDAEAVAALVSTAAAVAQLPLSFDAWRRARRPRSPITINVFGADAERIAEIMRAHGQTPPEPEPDPEPAAPAAPEPAAAVAPEPPAAVDPGSPDGTPPRPDRHLP